MLFTRNELKPLLQRVSTNDPDLTALHLSHKKITNKQLLQISDALKGNTHIAEVWLTNNQISDDGADGAGSVGYLAGVLESNRTVLELYLGGNNIGAKGASSIANLLRVNAVLTDVGLEDNALCDGSAKMLADALAHNETLQTLKLQGNDIQTERTLKTIQELLKKNRQRAKQKFEEEHPDMVTHKLKKPPPKEKKKKKKDRKSRDGKGGERKRRSKDGEGRSSREREGDRKPSSSSRERPSAGATGEARKPPPQSANDDAKPSSGGGLMGKFKGMGFGGKKTDDGGGGGMERNNGLTAATFV